tara:strand:- start:3383 stop:3595 length:213 start_codon:yes stop_codon:yes gene_type:complete
MSWYKVKILDKEVNWASVTASVIIFIGLEVYRRKYIRKQIKKDIQVAINQSQKIQDDKTKTLIDEILDYI